MQGNNHNLLWRNDWAFQQESASPHETLRSHKPGFQTTCLTLLRQRIGCHQALTLNLNFSEAKYIPV